MLRLTCALLALLLSLTSAAQDTSPLCRDEALSFEQARSCRDQPMGTLCYGADEVFVSAERPPQEAFARPGDWVTLPRLATLETIASPQHFGMARLRLVWRTPDAGLAQAHLLLLGGVRLEDRASAPDLPYQAFDLLTVPTCGSPIPQGLLVQTANEVPESPFFMVNGLVLRLRGTLFIQASPDPRREGGQILDVALLEGRASVFINRQEAARLRPAEAVRLRRPGLEAAWQVVTRAPYSLALVDLPVTLLARPFFVAFDASPLITPYDNSGQSPLLSILRTDPCAMTAGSPVNMRAGAGLEYPVMAVLNTRELVRPSGRAIGTDGDTWWRIAPYLWVKGALMITAGACEAVPLVESPAPR
ncbi:MAG: SH3 domain-containing protein [Anaerolineae bacterium]|nr:SH3 domain-containing protein [Anaerolineae bacterium]